MVKKEGMLGGVLGFLIDFGKILFHTLIDVLKQSVHMGKEALGSMRKMMK